MNELFETRALYSTPDEAMEDVVIPYLGDFVKDYDLDAIKDEIVEWVQEFNEDGIQLGNTEYRIKDLTEDEFNAVLMRHDISAKVATPESAMDILEDLDLSHNNAESFIQDNELFVVAEGPNNTTLPVTVPMGATNADLKEALKDATQKFSAEDELFEFMSSSDAELLIYIDEGIADIRGKTAWLHEGENPVSLDSLENELVKVGLIEGTEAGVYEDPAGFQVEMRASNGIHIYTLIPYGSTMTRAKELLQYAAYNETTDKRFSVATGDLDIGGLTPAQLLDALREDEKHFHKVADEIHN